MKIILIAGPTASGKTDTSVLLAKKIGGEVICTDSMQIYKNMDIGTAKVTVQEMDGVAHHMMDRLDPHENCSVAWFKAEVKEHIAEISSRGKIPILVGGTGFYINAILFDTIFDENTDREYKSELEAYYREHGQAALFSKLMEIDPESTKVIHPNNIKRVIRAIEYFYQNNEPISKHNKEEKNKRIANVSPYDYSFFALNMDRATLYERINKRVDAMVERGLFAEVEKLFAKGLPETCAAIQAIGYKELYPYFRKEISQEDAITLLKRNTRRFAKRQLTWFNNQSNPIFIEVDKFGFNSEKIVNTMIELSNLREY
ncbi:tRNA (adenosine(37)-N6)-dimethylallyltransferase MiaA [Candidatus Epulonipiscium viviparus]|uniref:tRNA (adenosine(37)-N6)-dimethylallyltransferase MiaA n=1 Tax=Candidatus Epulonipiscium viviparus TaxID=420336 RepID=UPI0009FC2C5B|nr:tRNA (adenosine(37)-N6)-dimethylallyltransferase MiaA [Candidatus Epulopiscium viviparus]